MSRSIPIQFCPAFWLEKKMRELFLLQLLGVLQYSTHPYAYPLFKSVPGMMTAGSLPILHLFLEILSFNRQIRLYLQVRE